MPKLSKADQDAKVSQNEARRRKEVALARLRELEVAEREGRMLPADAIEDRWLKVAAAINAALDRIPPRCAQGVQAARDVRDAERILAAEIRTIRTELSDALRTTGPAH